MTKDRADECSKFMQDRTHYQLVPSSKSVELPYNEALQRKFSTVTRQLTTIDEYDHDVTNRRAIFHQILATCAVLLLSVGCGLPIGYSAILLPQLSNDTSINIVIDMEMLSWIASVHSLATPFGSVLSGPLADSIGRRCTLLVSVIPLLTGWILLAITQTAGVLLVGRFICGFSTGVLGGPGQVYIAETTEPRLRNILIGAPYVAYSSGILLVYTLGSMLHWRTVALCAILLPISSGIYLLLIPESPIWLLRNGYEMKALKALKFLRGNEICAQKELNAMKDRLNAENVINKTNENIFKLCCHRVAMKPLFIVVVFSFLQMFSGTYIVIFYAIDMISEFGTDFDTKNAAIWSAVVRLLCTMLFCVILIFVRRRCITILGGIGSGISCITLSIFMYARLNQPKMSYDILVVGICLLSYIMFNTALMTIPGIMIGELFPARIRGRTAGTVFAAMNLTVFGFVKAYPFIQDALRMRGVFLVFGISCFLLTIFMFMFQPETHGRSLEQIEDYFNGDNWLWHKRDKCGKRNNSYKLVKQRELKNIVPTSV